MTNDFEFSRREFFRLGGGSAALALVGAAGLVAQAPVAQAAARPVALKVLNKQQARLLLGMSRTLFPHDFLGDDYYMKVVASVDAKASADTATMQLVRDGLAGLDPRFNVLGEAEREDQLQAIEKTPFFGLVRGETLNNIYGDPQVWAIFGYEGSSVEHGGYIDRGFDDIDWLPND
jgi:hypothetical protein